MQHESITSCGDLVVSLLCSVQVAINVIVATKGRIRVDKAISVEFESIIVMFSFHSLWLFSMPQSLLSSHRIDPVPVAMSGSPPQIPSACSHSSVATLTSSTQTKKSLSTSLIPSRAA